MRNPGAVLGPDEFLSFMRDDSDSTHPAAAPGLVYPASHVWVMKDVVGLWLFVASRSLNRLRREDEREGIKMDDNTAQRGFALAPDSKLPPPLRFVSSVSPDWQ